MNGLESGAARPPAQSFAERRQHPRVGVAWMATVRTSRGIYDCMVLDISLGGAKLAFSEPPAFADGDVLTIEIGRRGSLRAHAVWRRNDFAGIRFTDEPDQISAALRDVLPA